MSLASLNEIFSKMFVKLGTKSDLVQFLKSFTVIFCIFSTVNFIEGWRMRESPKIGIQRWITVDGEDMGLWQRDFDNLTEESLHMLDNGNTYVVFPHLTGLAFDCNATYPVQWFFHHAKHAGHQLYNVRIRTTRTASDIYTERTNQFSSQLELYGDSNTITGSYTCMSTEDNQLQKTIYVYWQGSSPPYLILSGETVSIRSKGNEKLELPCRVSQPDVKVFLLEETNPMDYEPVSSPYIKFDPKVGFIVDLYQYGNVFGRYKCTTEESDTFVLINVEKGAEQDFKFNNTMIGNASIFYSKEDEGILCCSNSSKPPNVQEVFCFDPVTCQMKEFLLHNVGNNANRHYKNGSCSFEKIYPRDSGLLRCKGDGIDVFRHFYTDMIPHSFAFSHNRSMNLYFNWADIKKENMMTLTLGGRKPIYSGQNLTFACDTSYFYFSEGLKWAIRWNNGSLIFVETNKNPDFGDIRFQSAFQNVRVLIHKNMTEILCFAPVWNTTEWLNKTMKLDVEESFSPKFDGPLVEVVTLTLNETEKVIMCKATGIPAPILRWRKNNKTITRENNMVVKRKNETSVLTIHRVSHETHGDYKCIAANLAGKMEKIIRVYIDEQNSSMGAIPIIFLILLLTSLGTGIGFLLWKMNLQKKIIDHLTGVVFRDVTPGENRNQNQTTVH